MEWVRRMTTDQVPSRRAVLKASAVALASISLAGCSSSGSSQPNTNSTETTTEAITETERTESTTQNTTDTTTETGSAETVTVGPDGEYSFDPAELTIRSGTTVRWEWASDNHNIVISEQPDGSNWQGTPGGSSDTYDEGYSYEHTFTTSGTFEYYCQPHQSVGMTGTLMVE